MLGFAFQEVMEGSVERRGERFDRPFWFDVAVSTPELLARVAMCDAEGTLHLDGLAKSVHAKGRLELSPLIEHRIRYVLDFTGDDGHRYQFDGSKTIAPVLSGKGLASPIKLLKSWTTLPGEIRALDTNEIWGRALLRFRLRKRLRALVASSHLTTTPKLVSSHA